MQQRNQELSSKRINLKQRFVIKKLAMSIITTSALLSPVATFANEQGLDSALAKGEQRANNAVKSQHKIDSVDQGIRSTEREYRSVIKENEGLRVYIEQLNKQLLNQERELSEIDLSIRQVTLIERQITPLMLRMIDSLALFIEADVPFQKQERLSRVSSLREIMGRSDVTVAEKYRKVMDAYQKEMDYGRTIKTYRDTINLSGSSDKADEREVDFLRVGRISLSFLSLDGESLGIWDQQSKEWQPLDASYKSKLNTALRIAREQAAPDLIKIPVAAPTKFESNQSLSTQQNSNLAHGDIK